MVEQHFTSSAQTDDKNVTEDSSSWPIDQVNSDDDEVVFGIACSQPEVAQPVSYISFEWHGSVDVSIIQTVISTTIISSIVRKLCATQLK